MLVIALVASCFAQFPCDVSRLPALPPPLLRGAVESVAVDGEFLAVGGAVSGLANGTDEAVYVYKRSGANWQFDEILAPEEDQLHGESYGSSVALEKDVLVVGFPHFSYFSGTVRTGTVYIYRHCQPPSDGHWCLDTKLSTPSIPQGHYFGASVAISDGVIAIGNPGESEPGAVHIYRQDRDTWILDGVLLGSEYGTDGFGGDVDIDHDAVVVGAPSSYGSAYVFRRDRTGWNLEETLFGSNREIWDEFGAVSISGDRIVVGVPNGSGTNGRSGRAIVFEHEKDHWVEVVSLTNPQGQAGDNFGAAIEQRHSLIVIGAPLETRPDNYDGAVYLFQEACQDWHLTERMVSPDSGRFGFGDSISITDSSLVISGTGAVYTSPLSCALRSPEHAPSKKCARPPKH